MYTWIKNRNIKIKKLNHVDYWDTPEHKKHPTLELKLSIIRRCFQEGEEIKSVSEETGYSGASIYLWRRKYVVGGASSLVSKKKHLPRGKIITDTSGHDSRQEELVSKIKELEMENDILKETIKILKKIRASINLI
ncbi:MAG: transposase [Thomasclavelia spiroformis]|uniref:transposase n=1 Tax=Thomasclavelia spiroformis TaxID=29348 RepID=UPI0039904846